MDSKFYKEIGEFVENARKNNGSLTDQNLLYVVKVATDISSQTGADFDMLLGEGTIGMKKAEEKYDPSRNDSFVKFAAPSVRGYMLNAVNRQGTLVHIPANHMQGFKKGQCRFDESNVEYVEIDSTNYDTFGSEEIQAFGGDMDCILQNGLKQLDVNGRIAIEMKLRLGKYSEMIISDENPEKLIYKYKNNMQSIAEELEVPINTATKIYKDAFAKLSKYCQASYNE